MNPFSAPQTIFCRQTLNQGDCFREQFRATAVMARLEFPKEPKALAMPTEEGVGFENQKGFFPVFHASSEEDGLSRVLVCEHFAKRLLDEPFLGASFRQGSIHCRTHIVHVDALEKL